jgi:hypothetical protein
VAFVQTSRRLIGANHNIDTDIITTNKSHLIDIFQATDHKEALQASGAAVLYFNKEKHQEALKLAIAGRNVYMLDKWLVNNIPITIGSYNKVHVDINSKTSLVGYSWLCHVGNKSIGSRSFLLDPLVTMMRSLLPGPLKGCKIKITEEKESMVTTSPCVTFDIIPANNLISPINVKMGMIEGIFILFGNGLSYSYFHGFFEQVYLAYTQVTAKSLRVRYPSSLTYCWSCRKMASCQVCSGCGCARFCSNLCRYACWPVHKHYCNKTVSFTIQF